MSCPEACSGDRLDFLPLKSLAKCSRYRISGGKKWDTTLPFRLFFYADFLIAREMRDGRQFLIAVGIFFRFGFSIRQYRYLHVLSQWDSDVLTVMPSVIVLRVAAQRPAPSGFSRA
jgi:hypothetical protein